MVKLSAAMQPLNQQCKEYPTVEMRVMQIGGWGAHGHMKFQRALPKTNEQNGYP